jgi:hypothetical protein
MEQTGERIGAISIARPKAGLREFARDEIGCLAAAGGALDDGTDCYPIPQSIFLQSLHSFGGEERSGTATLGHLTDYSFATTVS